MSYHTCPTNR